VVQLDIASWQDAPLGSARSAAAGITPAPATPPPASAIRPNTTPQGEVARPERRRRRGAHHRRTTPLPSAGSAVGGTHP
jgi:hypothetical protein